MRDSRLGSARAMLGDITHTRVLGGSCVVFRTSQFLNHAKRAIPAVTRLCDALLKRLPSKAIIIRNSIGTFEISAPSETVGISSEYYEYYMRSWLLRPRKRRIFIDIGACIGTMTIAALRSYKTCIAFEPNPSTFVLLTRNISLNARDGAELVPAGLSDREGTLRFTAQKHYFGRSRITKMGEIKVPVHSLDAFLRGRKLSPEDVDCLKIDVEGHERQVLRGMRETLRAMPSGSRIAIEIWDDTTTRNRTMQFLEYHGFVLEERVGDNHLFRKVLNENTTSQS